MLHKALTGRISKIDLGFVRERRWHGRWNQSWGKELAAHCFCAAFDPEDMFFEARARRGFLRGDACIARIPFRLFRPLHIQTFPFNCNGKPRRYQKTRRLYAKCQKLTAHYALGLLTRLAHLGQMFAELLRCKSCRHQVENQLLLGLLDRRSGLDSGGPARPQHLWPLRRSAEVGPGFGRGESQVPDPWGSHAATALLTRQSANCTGSSCKMQAFIWQCSGIDIPSPRLRERISLYRAAP